MEQLIHPDRFHRLAKYYMDTGAAGSYAEAYQILTRLRLSIEVGPDIADSPSLQACLLTAVNTARRCFLGGVFVNGPLAVPLRLTLPHLGMLAEAVTDLQGNWVETAPIDIPKIQIGNLPDAAPDGPFCVRAVCDGWLGGVIPSDEVDDFPRRMEFTPAGVLSGALAVSEAFQHVAGNAYAGRRTLGLSLWEPGGLGSWLESSLGQPLRSLPSRAWLIGLGHLGQAYLWTLGFLPYACPGDVELVLQDVDALLEANDSTSLLTHRSMVGALKTRTMASWCNARGFRSRIVERTFTNDFHLAADEPRLALCGVDNPQARAALEEVGFERILEAGLGGRPDDFLCFQTHTFPAAHTARYIWGSPPPAPLLLSLSNLPPAYQVSDPLSVEACGMAQLAGRSVGTAFVGAVTSTLVIADLLRMMMGERHYEFIDGDLRTGKIRCIPRMDSGAPVNLGLTKVA